MELLLSPEHLDEADQVRVLQVLERVDPTRIAAMLNFCMYMTIELSQLMLNLYVARSAGSFLHHAGDMHSLSGSYNIYGTIWQIKKHGKW